MTCIKLNSPDKSIPKSCLNFLFFLPSYICSYLYYTTRSWDVSDFCPNYQKTANGYVGLGQDLSQRRSLTNPFPILFRRCNDLTRDCCLYIVKNVGFPAASSLSYLQNLRPKLPYQSFRPCLVLKIFQDSSSHRIFGRIHRALNINKKNN